MDFRIHREERIDENTLGILTVDDTTFRCHVLEDLERVVKVKTRTAIAVGRYRMRLSKSPKFGRVTLEVLEVPDFSGIRLHAGTSHKDTWGCPLVGWSRKEAQLRLSRSCEKALTALAEQAVERGEELWLTITSDLKPLEENIVA